MRLNYDITIIGKKVQLVPYRKKFVLRYHEWMKSPEMLELTASEPLSLDEEYEMQCTWKNDDNKCTFIVLSIQSVSSPDFADNEVARMVGDVNLFLSRSDEDEIVGEVDIMIAEKDFHRTGCGREAVMLMMWYAKRKLSVTSLFAKINESNTSSRKLFESLGFKEANYVAAFQEYEYRFDLQSSDAVESWGSEDIIHPYTCDEES
eukprot:gene31434-37992_t